MYNRYIPQPDGSFQCRRVEPRRPPPPPSKPQRPPESCREPQPCPPPPCPPPCQDPPKPRPCSHDSSVGSFFRNILPKDFDTGDLIVVLLLLLLAGDCQEDRNNALLTLVLYLFM